jgi:molecular chaperone GrpE
MTSQSRDDERGGADEPRRVKVTDKRRVHADERVDVSTSLDDVGAPEPSEGPEVEEAAAREAVTLEEARRQAEEYRDHLQRLAADFDNYRKRVLKEQTRAVEMAAEPLVRRLLEVLDEFDLALMAAERRPEFEQFLHGVELVYAKLLDILRAEGLERIEAMGQPFDPERHEALMQSGDGHGEPYVADVLRHGYALKGRVIRPAGVKVARS